MLSSEESGFKRTSEGIRLHKAGRLIGQLQMEPALTKKELADAKAKRELLELNSDEVYAKRSAKPCLGLANASAIKLSNIVNLLFIP